MVWTGEEMIVWGVGWYPNDTDATGGRLRLDERRGGPWPTSACRRRLVRGHAGQQRRRMDRRGDGRRRR